MSRISVRGFAVASATAVTAVGAVAGVATADDKGDTQPVEALDASLLADIPAGTQAQQASVQMGQQAQAQADAADASARKAAEESARRQAAETAAAKKAKADAEAAAKKAEKEASTKAATVSTAVQSSYTVAEVQSMARGIVGNETQFQCFSNIVSRESGWNYRAVNASSGAYGLMQALPGSKYSSVGSDWQTNPATQIQWGLNYMNSRYDSPCGAWSFWQANNWY